MEGNEITQVYSSLIWAILILTVVILLKKDIRSLLGRLSSFNMTEGRLEFESLKERIQAIEDIKESFSLEYRDNKTDLNAGDVISLMDQKLKSLEGNIQKLISGKDIRTDKRTSFTKNINITRSEGAIVGGIAKDISGKGIGFTSSTHLKRNEIVSIVQEESSENLTNVESTLFLIKRIQPRGNEFYYGAKAVIPKIKGNKFSIEPET